MTQLKTLFVSAALAALAACAGGSDTPAKSETTAGTVSAESTSDAQATCVASFARQRECTDQFIPALVDARVRADKPPGIAAKAQSEGRDALIAEGKTEFAEDSKPEAASETCTHMISALPNPKMEEALAQAKSCLGVEGCDAFVACEIPIIEATLR